MVSVRAFQHIVMDEMGLHAGPAGFLVKLLSSCSSDFSVVLHSKK